MAYESVLKDEHDKQKTSCNIIVIVINAFYYLICCTYTNAYQDQFASSHNVVLSVYDVQPVTLQYTRCT